MTQNELPHVSPWISVVIPTARRPHLLPRAVTSALAALDPSDVEVIVVPSGPDTSWKDSLRPFDRHPSVRVFPIEKAHPSAARNEGLRAARGKYVRFLDDDDFLYPDAAVGQCAFARSCDLDACSATLELIDEKGRTYGEATPTHLVDLPSVILGPGRATIPAAHVFRTTLIQHILWNEGLTCLEDVEWLMHVVQLYPTLRWKPFPQAVGVWYQHAGTRESPALTTNSSQAALAGWIQDTVDALRTHNQLTSIRRLAAARGLWQCAHRAFQFSPLFWARIAADAMRLAPEARPEIRLLGRNVGNFPYPLILEWLAVPLRLLSHGIRRLRHRLRGESPIRGVK
jgi:glycosyltransferase involved in cell wall biosynthesis